MTSDYFDIGPITPELSFDIAGVQYYISFEWKECGLFDGYLQAEPNNEYDPNAVKICKKDGTMVGHVRRVKAPLIKECIGNKKWPCQIRLFNVITDEDREELRDDEDDLKDWLILEGRCSVKNLNITQQEFDDYEYNGQASIPSHSVPASPTSTEVEPEESEEPEEGHSIFSRIFWGILGGIGSVFSWIFSSFTATDYDDSVYDKGQSWSDILSGKGNSSFNSDNSQYDTSSKSSVDSFDWELHEAQIESDEYTDFRF